MSSNIKTASQRLVCSRGSCIFWISNVDNLDGQMFKKPRKNTLKCYVWKSLTGAVKFNTGGKSLTLTLEYGLIFLAGNCHACEQFPTKLPIF